ncbi:exodeoxyribonuclease VII small subunit [Marinigracilibium pacificum]|uniref:Exodeoxyribonuclease VII small subunit n=1 Tax=Marinigracilibium pacificum TaxID=2729599 RepID=A0A848J0L0_9BACT|nr:exodeoxyribonuclease VII small subunit [Marinigracilibium pacificum]NMM48014.1 exodeoxyribonuclease VII small subunit [Marinigracilibium pacificum]
MTKNKSFNYKESIERLNKILEKLENQEGDIDELMKDVEEATNIIKTCRGKLRSVEKQLSDKFDDIDN